MPMQHFGVGGRVLVLFYFRFLFVMCTAINDQRVVDLSFLTLQEIDPVSGEEVCRLFPRDRRIDLNAIAMKSKQALKLNGIAQVEARAPSPRGAPYYRLDILLFELELFSVVCLTRWTLVT